jgi:hypothetical protein
MCDEQPGARFPTTACEQRASFAERNTQMIDGFPLSFFLPLVVHALAALTTGVTGVITFSRPKRRGRHPKWGVRYLWAYTVVFLTAIILSVQHWPTDAYLVVLATIGCRLLRLAGGARARGDPHHAPGLPGGVPGVSAEAATDGRHAGLSSRNG